MRHYETTYILRPNLGEDQFTEIIERTNAIVTDAGGSIIDIERLGIRKLAYEIKKETQGYYVYMNYAAPGTTVSEIERIFRIDDQLLRYLTIKLADSIDAAGINEEIDKIAAEIAAAEAAEAEKLAEAAEREEAEKAEKTEVKTEAKAEVKADEKSEEKTEEKVEEKADETESAETETAEEKAS